MGQAASDENGPDSTGTLEQEYAKFGGGRCRRALMRPLRSCPWRYMLGAIWGPGFPMDFVTGQVRNHQATDGLASRSGSRGEDPRPLFGPLRFVRSLRCNLPCVGADIVGTTGGSKQGPTDKNRTDARLFLLLAASERADAIKPARCRARSATAGGRAQGQMAFVETRPRQEPAGRACFLRRRRK